MNKAQVEYKVFGKIRIQGELNVKIMREKNIASLSQLQDMEMMKQKP